MRKSKTFEGRQLTSARWLRRSLVLAVGLAAGCGKPDGGLRVASGPSELDAALEESDAEASDHMKLTETQAPVRSGSTVRFFPASIKVRRGTVSLDQPVGVLSVADQTGNDEEWMSIKDFQPAATGGHVSLLAVPVAPEADIFSGGKLFVNYRGWDLKKQKWRFQIFNFQNRSWVHLGDNRLAGSWVWTQLEYKLPQDLRPYINIKNNALTFRYISSSSLENSFLDYFAVEALANGSPPAPAPTTEPSPQPSSAPASEPVPEPVPDPSSSPGSGDNSDDDSGNGAGLLPGQLPGTGRIPAGQLYGVTTDNGYDGAGVAASVGALSKKVVTRIVYDEGVAASDYLNGTRQISQASYVMGELLDSFYVKTYSTAAYLARMREYLQVLGSHVDIWEVGNEINGEWLGNTSEVIAKVSGAFDVAKAAGAVTTVTLYYNKDCWANPANEMFRWTEANLPERMKNGLEYVLVSYYEDDCNGLRPDWPAVFSRLATIFPNSRLGIGEMGTTKSGAKQDHLTRYYNLSLPGVIPQPRFIGGYFYWYYHQDMVPATKSLWAFFDDLLRGLP